jgi:hypothetical protein
LPDGEPEPLTNNPDARIAAAKSAIVIQRNRFGVRNPPTCWPSQTRRPLAVETLAAAVIMHWTHIRNGGYAAAYVGARAAPRSAERHSRSMSRMSAGYTIKWRNGRIAAMYAAPSGPFGFTRTAI